MKRTQGLVSIYLRRGSADKEIVYGLSDIDLLVLLDDDHVQNKEHVGKIYDRLSAFIPLFGDKEKELGVHSIAEFLNLYRDHNSYRYRFDEGKHQWRLLAGQDFVKTLDPLEETELVFLATEELKVWWAFLTTEFDPDCPVPRFKSKYLWYKAIAEAAKIYLFTGFRKKIYSRATGLDEVRKYLPAEFQTTLQEIAGYISNLTGRKPVLADESMQLFIWLTNRAYDNIELAFPTGHRQIPAIVSISPQDSKACKEFLQIKEGEVPPMFRDLEPYIERLAIIPQVEFDIDILNNSDIDSFYLAIILKKALPVSAMKNIVKMSRLARTQRNCEPFLVWEGKLAFSLLAAKPVSCLKSIKSDSLFFSLLDNSGTVNCYLPGNFEKTLRTRLARINTMISNKEIYRVRNLDFCRFFWAAARTKMLAAVPAESELEIPLTGRQIADQLIKKYPGKSDWINRLYQEYTRELLGRENELHLFFADAIDFLYRM